MLHSAVPNDTFEYPAVTIVKTARAELGYCLFSKEQATLPHSWCWQLNFRAFVNRTTSSFAFRNRQTPPLKYQELNRPVINCCCWEELQNAERSTAVPFTFWASTVIVQLYLNTSERALSFPWLLLTPTSPASSEHLNLIGKQCNCSSLISSL